MDGALLGIISVVTTATFGFVMIATLTLMPRVVTKREWPVFLLLVGLAIVFAFEQSNFFIGLLLTMLFIGTIWFLTLRVGLLALLVFFLMQDAGTRVPYTLDSSDWWITSTWIVGLTVAGLTLWSFRTALGGQPVFRNRFIED